ncbi:hypothetical protein HDU86_003161, partial [Geranomyces michiganensis]
IEQTPTPPGWHLDPWAIRLRQPDREALARWQNAAKRVHLIVQQELRDAQDHKEQYCNQGQIAIGYKPGDQIDLFREGIVIDTDAGKPLKFTEKWIGPFTIISPGPHPDMYELDLTGSVIGDIWPVFHVNVLQPHVSAQHLLQPTPPPPPPIHIGGHQEWPIRVTCIKDEQYNKRQKT